MRLNATARATPIYTHQGAPAYLHLSPLQQLRRSVLACLLWEDTFYEDGQSIADRIATLALKVPPHDLAALAIEARHEYNLRHVPLLLLQALGKTGSGIAGLTANTVQRVISRADELAEILAIYWRNGKQPLPAQFKKGLARAFAKFGAHQLAKYDRPNAVKLRDVMRMVHPKPEDASREVVYACLVSGTLATPDTWEVALSGGKDKCETFTRLLTEGKLGYMALLKNLRLMDSVGVNASLIESAILARHGAHNVLPFRYISAARAAPRFERALDTALCETVSRLTPLSGNTVIVCDCSGSMFAKLSAKSEVTRFDAMAALAGCIPAQSIRMVAYSDWAKEVAARVGMSCVDALRHAGSNGGTDTRKAVLLANQLGYDRIILITDEQSSTPLPDPLTKLAYCINVASYQNGIGYGAWTHIDGFSEAVIRYIAEVEKLHAD